MILLIETTETLPAGALLYMWGDSNNVVTYVYRQPYRHTGI